jgi:hypothetical protein
MTIIRTKDCDVCESNRPGDTWREIGEEVLIQGGKIGDTRHRFFQCTACGSVWVEIRDIGGMAGGGPFYHRITQRFF